MENEKVITSDADLRQLAADIYDGKVFTDRQVLGNTNLGFVFMPIILGAFSGKTPEELNDIGLIYERLSEAGTRSVNGMPVFFSMKVLTKSDMERTFIFLDEYKLLKEKFLNKE